jgi:hypothetical protein
VRSDGEQHYENFASVVGWAISEAYQKGPGDDIYANNPVNYVKLDRLPAGDDWSGIVNALKRGDYFWTSGEVLIPSYAVEGTGSKRTITADVEWDSVGDGAFVQPIKLDGAIMTTTSR